MTPLVSHSEPSIVLDAEQNAAVNLDDVYQVEVIAFAHRYQEAGEQQQWQANPSLHYPDKLIFLRDVLDPVQLLHDSVLPNEPTTRAVIESSTIADAPFIIDDEIVTGNTISLAQDKSLTTNEETQLQNNQIPSQILEIPVSLAPELMLSLDEKELTLSSIATKLSRQSRYRLLFHKSWYQELQPKKTAPAMPLSGGTVYDDHHELEGTIRISKNRFLHVTAHLWLTDFVEKGTFLYEETIRRVDAGRALPINATLPMFPIRPLPVPLTVPLSEPNDLLDQEAESLEELIALSDNKPESALNTNQVMTTKPVKGNIFTTSTYSQDKLRSDEVEVEVEVEVSLVKPNLYQIKSIVELKEYRKMRRNEVHYLDHPLFGIIVKITKFEPKEETLADEGT